MWNDKFRNLLVCLTLGYESHRKIENQSCIEVGPSEKQKQKSTKQKTFIMQLHQIPKKREAKSEPRTIFVVTFRGSMIFFAEDW